MKIYSIQTNPFISYPKIPSKKQVCFGNDKKPTASELLQKRDSILNTIKVTQAKINTAMCYNEKLSKARTEKAIELEKERKNIGILKSIYSSEGDKIKERHYNKFLIEKSEVEYVKRNKEYFKKIIEQSREHLAIIDQQIEQLTGTPIDALLQTFGKDNTSINPHKTYALTPKTNVNSKSPQETKEKTPPPIPTKLPTLEEFTDLERRWNLTPNDDPMKKVLGKEKVSMRKAMIEGNVSFVPKPPQHFSSQEEKNQYILNALECTYINESSAMDALNVFDKFGSRFEYGYKNSENSISDLSIAVSYAAKELDPKTADKIFNKFIDLFGKFADITPPRHNDTRKLDNIIIEHHEKMSEDTINKFIDTLEKLSFEQSTAWNIRKNIIENEYTKRSPEEITRIDSRLKKLEEKIKDLPFRDKSRHNG